MMSNDGLIIENMDRSHIHLTVLILEAQAENYRTSTLHYRKLEVESCGNFSADDLPSTFFLAFTPHWAQITLKVPLASLSMQYMVSQGSEASESIFALQTQDTTTLLELTY